MIIMDYVRRLWSRKGKIPEFESEEEDEEGWSDWIHPLPGYQLACCDCGLVHNIEFRIDDLGQINFRAGRNGESTAELRRRNNIKVKLS